VCKKWKPGQLNGRAFLCAGLNKKETEMKFILIVLVVKAAIAWISKKERAAETKTIDGSTVQHPAEMQLR
jgi:hypothetical protein